MRGVPLPGGSGLKTEEDAGGSSGSHDCRNFPQSEAPGASCFLRKSYVWRFFVSVFGEIQSNPCSEAAVNSDAVDYVEQMTEYVLKRGREVSEDDDAITPLGEQPGPF